MSSWKFQYLITFELNKVFVDSATVISWLLILNDNLCMCTDMSLWSTIHNKNLGNCMYTPFQMHLRLIWLHLKMQAQVWITVECPYFDVCSQLEVCFIEFASFASSREG